MPEKPAGDFTPEEIQWRMNAAIRRALNTPPKPMKESIGKSKRAQAQRENPVKKSVQSGQKSP